MFYSDMGLLIDYSFIIDPIGPNQTGNDLLLKKLKSDNIHEKIWTKMERLGKKRKI